MSLNCFAIQKAFLRILPIKIHLIESSKMPMNTNNPQNHTCTTEQLASYMLVKPGTIRARYCSDGHYYGSVPTKLPNGRLAWPIPQHVLKGNKEHQK